MVPTFCRLLHIIFFKIFNVFSELNAMLRLKNVLFSQVIKFESHIYSDVISSGNQCIDVKCNFYVAICHVKVIESGVVVMPQCWMCNRWFFKYKFERFTVLNSVVNASRYMVTFSAISAQVGDSIIRAGNGNNMSHTYVQAFRSVCMAVRTLPSHTSLSWSQTRWK